MPRQKQIIKAPPQCWGRTLSEVLDNCERWNADYTIIYQESGSKLAGSWEEAFELISEYDWGDYQYLLRGDDLWPRDKPTPKWFLLKPKYRAVASMV